MKARDSEEMEFKRLWLIHFSRAWIGEIFEQ